jgi:hypothetical protein
MPTLRNPKHEKFAQLVASGLTAQAAFTQAGYKAPQNSPRLRNDELVAKRIEELQERNERKAEKAAITRDELIVFLGDIVHSARSRLSEVRTADALKATELLAKMCGWQEQETQRHEHIHLQVDSALIEQLRDGYAALAGRGGPIKAIGGGMGGTHPEAEATSATNKGHTPPPVLDGTQNNTPPSPSRGDPGG